MPARTLQSETDFSDLDDAALAARVQAGDRGAFRWIVQRCNQRVYRAVRSVLRNEGDVEDVMQDAYVLAFRKIDGYRGESSLPTWVATIAINAAYASVRRRRETVEMDTVDEERDSGNVVAFPGMAEGEDPICAAERQQLRRWLESAIDALPDGFRLVYLLRDVEGCSIEETAQALELRAETVKTRLHRARRQLRAALEGKVAAAQGGVFEYMGARCAGMTERVMARIAALS